MDVTSVISALRLELHHLDRAILALEMLPFTHRSTRDGPPKWGHAARGLRGNHRSRSSTTPETMIGESGHSQ
jgi:hypothetical protein